MTVENVVFYSQVLGRDFEYRILLPDGAARPLRTLYLLHGYGGNSAQWLAKSDVKRWAEIFGVAVVLPSAGSGFYQDNARTGVRMKTFIGTELVDHTRAHFPLSHRREDTFIAGVSMGGFGSLLIGFRYSERFSKAAAAAGAFVPGILGSEMSAWYFLETFGDYATLEGSDREPYGEALRALAEGRMIPAYLTCGKQDIHLECGRRMARMLTEAGAEVVWREEDGGHDWDFFNNCFPAMLDWLTAAE